MRYCTRCGKPTNNGIMCEDCIILGSPWLLAMKSKEDDLVEQNEKLKSENADLRDKLKNAGILSHAVGDRAIIKETGEIRKCGGIHIYMSQTGIKSVRYHFENLEGYLKENDISWV